jgi:hypothetical protein
VRAFQRTRHIKAALINGGDDQTFPFQIVPETTTAVRSRIFGTLCMWDSFRTGEEGFKLTWSKLSVIEASTGNIFCCEDEVLVKIGACSFAFGNNLQPAG